MNKQLFISNSTHNRSLWR